MFSQDDMVLITEGFDRLVESNIFFKKHGCRRLVYPNKLTEILAGFLYSSVTGNDIVYKGNATKGDIFNITANKDIEVKSTIISSSNDCSSFGAGESFDSILFLEIDEREKSATLFDIPISNNDLMDIVVSKNGETFKDKCLNGNKKRRPHFSIREYIIKKKGITPMCKAYYKEGHWQI